MNKSLVNQLYLKQALYSFKMQEDKLIVEQLDMFNELILDQKNIGAIIDDEDQALLLLCSLPRSHVYFKESLMFGRDSLSLEEVQATLNSKELNERKDLKASSMREGLVVKGKSHKKENKGDKKKTKS